MRLLDWLKANWIGEVLVRRTPLLYRRLRYQFDYLAKAPRMAREDFWQSRERELLAALRRTPWGKAHSVPVALCALPLLEKATLRSDAAQFSAPQWLPAPAAQTSGTTGTPLQLKRSWLSIVAEQVALDWLAAQAGVDLRHARVAVLRADNIKPPGDLTPPFWRDKMGGRVRSFSANHLCAATIQLYIDALKEFGPEVLWVYPSALEALLGLATPRGMLLPTLRLVLSSSEMLSLQTRQQAEASLAVPVYDYYGQAERVNIAYSVNGLDYFFHPAYGITELHLTRQDTDCDCYEILGSSAWNTAQPLFRYRTGDLARLPKGVTAGQVQEIALGLQPFMGIEGRTSDYLLSPDGVKLIGMNHIPRGVRGAIQVQLVQTSTEEVKIYVVPSDTYGKADEAQLLHQARVKIPATMRLTVHVVDRIARNTSGKAPLVVRKIGA